MNVTRVAVLYRKHSVMNLLGQKPKSADGQNSHTDTDNLYETLQRYFDVSAAKHTRLMMTRIHTPTLITCTKHCNAILTSLLQSRPTRLMMTFTEENRTKIDTLLTRVA